MLKHNKNLRIVHKSVDLDDMQNKVSIELTDIPTWALLIFP